MKSGKNSNEASGNGVAIPDTLNWSVHPSSHHPVKSALTVMVIAMIGGAVFQATGGLFYSVLAVTVLLAAVSPFFFRTDYKLDNAGVTAKRFGKTRQLPWRSIRCVTPGRDSVYVSPYKPDSIQERKGILLMCPSNFEIVRALIKKQTSEF